MLHRDLKPENIMLGKYGETLVVDWGLAKRIDAPEGSDYGTEAAIPRSSDSGSHLTVEGSAMGTPAYMSPEQASGHLVRLGPASDVYSLGATLYCVPVNRPPFVPGDGDDADALLGRVRRGEFPRPHAVRPGVPFALEAVCLKAMALAPEGRYATPRALADDVERWLADAPVTAWREPVSARAGRWVAQNRSMMATAGAVIAVALIAAGFLVVVESQANVKLAGANHKLQATLRLAMDSVRSNYTGVSEDVLLKQPQFAWLRNRLLRTPLEFYRRLKDLNAGAGDSDPQALAALGEACLRVAAITDRIGVKDDALGSYREALEIYTRLAHDHPSEPAYRAGRAEALDGLGSVLHATGSAAQALRSRRDALGLWKALAAANPSDLKTRVAEAACLKAVGVIETDGGRFEDALRAYSLARGILLALLDDYPDDPALRSELVGCLNRIASVQASSRSMGEAQKTNAEALAHLDRLKDAAPDDPRFRYEAATCYRYIGGLQCRAGRFEDGLESFRRAGSTLESLVKDHPAVTQFRIDQAASRLQMAWPLQKLRRLDEAKRGVGVALELVEAAVRVNPNVTGYQSQLAWCHGEMANIDEAAGRLVEALRSFEGAGRICRKLVEDHPQNFQYKMDRAMSLINVGRVQGALGRWPEARETLKGACEVIGPCVRERPDEIDLRAVESEALSELAQALVILRRPWGEVLGHALRAKDAQRLVFDRSPESDWYRRTLVRRYHVLARVYRELRRRRGRRPGLPPGLGRRRPRPVRHGRGPRRLRAARRCRQCGPDPRRTRRAPGLRRRGRDDPTPGGRGRLSRREPPPDGPGAGPAAVAARLPAAGGAGLGRGLPGGPLPALNGRRPPHGRPHQDRSPTRQANRHGHRADPYANPARPQGRDTRHAVRTRVPAER